MKGRVSGFAKRELLAVAGGEFPFLAEAALVLAEKCEFVEYSYGASKSEAERMFLVDVFYGCFHGIREAFQEKD